MQERRRAVRGRVAVRANVISIPRSVADHIALTDSYARAYPDAFARALTIPEPDTDTLAVTIAKRNAKHRTRRKLPSSGR